MKNLKNKLDASSMADIAFLLLIFFLVATTIDLDKGLLNKLPEISTDESMPLSKNNVLELAMNSSNQIMLEGKIVGVEKIKENARKHVLNFGEDPNFADNPKKAVVLLEIERGTSYDLYIQVQNELKVVYSEIRNEQTLALSQGVYSYSALGACIEKANDESVKCKEYKEKIKKDFPMILIEK